MDQRATIIGLGVKDLKVASEFYEECFGWERSAMSNDGIVFYKLNGLLLSLYPKDKLAEDAGVNSEGLGFKSFSLAYNARSEDEVDQLVEKLRSKGVNIVKDPQKVFWGGYSSYVYDPDENLWEIAYNPFLELDEQGNCI